MSSYRYTEYGSPYPTQTSYHDNSGYYGGSNHNLQQQSRPASTKGGSNYQPVQMYPSAVERGSRSETYSWHMLRAAVVSVCCCPFFGLIGLVYALLSYVEISKGNVARYKAWKSCSLGWSVTSIVCGCIGLILTVVLVSLVYTGFISAVVAASIG